MAPGPGCFGAGLILLLFVGYRGGDFDLVGACFHGALLVRVNVVWHPLQSLKIHPWLSLEGGRGMQDSEMPRGPAEVWGAASTFPCRGFGGAQHPLQLWVPPVPMWGPRALQGTPVPIMFAGGLGLAAPQWPVWHRGHGEGLFLLRFVGALGLP